MDQTHACRMVVLAVALVSCGPDDDAGEDAGATSGPDMTDADDPAQDAGATSGPDMTDADGPEQVAGFCALGCNVEIDCAAAGGGVPEDWICNQSGLTGTCEFAGETPPACDPRMCPAETAALCDRHFGAQVCVSVCDNDDDCPAPLMCSGTLDDGAAYCAANADVGCTAGGCTCFDDADCPEPGLICGPNDG